MSKNKTLDEKTLAILEHLKLLEALRAKGAPTGVLKNFEKEMFAYIKSLRQLPTD